MMTPLPASTSQDDQTVAEAPALVPKLTAFDKRLLSKLDTWDPFNRDKKTVWRTPWEVAELLRVDDVAMVRSVLRGLHDFQHVISIHYGPRQRWARRLPPKEGTDV